MRNVRAISILSILILVPAVAALASPDGKAHRQAPAAPATLALAPVDETEPNDDCATGDPVSAGDVMFAGIDPLGDRDFFELVVGAGDALYIHTFLHDGDPGMLQDSELTLYADDCATVLGFNDDSVGLESALLHQFDLAGTYYAMVQGYDDDETGNYELLVEDVVISPVGDNCLGATSIPHGESLFVASTTGMTDDYGLPGSGYGVGAPDAVFGFVLSPGEFFSCQLDVAGTDFVIYIATDCADPEASMLQFSDGDPETIDYLNESGEPQTIYMFVDGYLSSSHGGFVLWADNGGEGIVGNTAASWGDVKAFYR
ncbi:hypothetical protein H8E07_11265 [bacterium]|nr:hypothetical protein [bacterium]